MHDSRMKLLFNILHPPPPPPPPPPITDYMKGILTAHITPNFRSVKGMQVNKTNLFSLLTDIISNYVFIQKCEVFRVILSQP